MGFVDTRAEVVWQDNFESTPTNWTATGNVWQWGTPTAANGPSAAHSGIYCAGTITNGNYLTGADARLMSRQFVVPTSTQNPRLKYWYWYCMGTLASGQLQIRVGTNAWQNLPELISEKCDGGWSQRIVDLRPYAGQNVQIGFYFHSYVYATAAGWYIDDVSLENGPMAWISPEGFENGFGDWSVENGVWQVGTLAGAHSGSKCAGTVLNGNYPYTAGSRLVSPQFVVPASTQNPRLTYWCWYCMGTLASGQLQIRVGANAWQNLPELISEKCDGGWSQRIVDLRTYAGQTVQIGFYFYCGVGYATAAGWYIDDVSLDTGPMAWISPEGFENGNGFGDWSAENGVWQIGRPTATNGPAPHSGMNCAGTVLWGNYPYTAGSRLVSPQFVVPASTQNPQLKYWDWYCMGTLANGQLQIRVDTNAWQKLPELISEKCDGGWSQRIVDLRPYAGQTVQIGFYFYCGVGYATYAGWYIDDISVDGIQPPPSITNISPDPVIGSNSAQPFYINGANFVAGCNVTLRDLTAGQTFPNRTITSFSSTQIRIDPNFTTAAHNWSAEVINLDGQTSGQFDFSVAAPSAPPTITASPQSQTVLAATSASFHVVTTGTPPLNYQWRKNGVNIAGANSATLDLNSVTASDSDCYSVVVWNAYGSTVSDLACLAVLTDGANGNTPVQPTRSSLPAKLSSAKNLVFITHGWQWRVLHPITPPLQPWMADMTNAIAQQLEAKGELTDWQLETYTWLQDAWTVNPDTALNSATNLGAGLGMQLAAQGWQQVHLIAHSAGAGMIQEVADTIRANSPSTVIQITFLDPFTGLNNWALSWYGSNADWTDDYYTAIDETSIPNPFATGLPLPKAYAVDVSWVDPDPSNQPVQYIGGPVAVSSHGYPIDFYLGSISGGNFPCSSSYGFSLSMEKEGASWINNQVNDPVGSGPFLPCSPPDAVRNPNSGVGALESVVVGTVIDFYNAAYAASGVAATLIGDAGFELQSIWSALPLTKQGGIKPQGPSTSNPSWLAVGVSITNAVNLVQFDVGFTSTNAAEGLLTVFWNTNEIGMVDERVASPGSQTYRFALPGTVTSGLYTLSFRLDAFNNTSSSITVTNVATGFVGITQPITLSASLNTNGAPVLQLTGAPGYNYLLQSSANLSDWTPAALLANTNGTVFFADPASTNSGQRFYRAVLP